MAKEIGVADSPTPTEISSSQIPTEIISDEEMSLIEAAFSLAFASRSTSTSLNLRRYSTAINQLTKRNHPASYFTGDIEDGVTMSNTQKKKKVNESLLRRFKRKSGLFVTDITATEWCEKQKEFFLVCGKPKASEAMKAGTARHAVLEEEVITRVEIVIRSAEEQWALKMINFINGVNQLYLDGLTRELPLIGFTEGVCVVGIIDEIRMKTGTTTFVETKTRSQNNLPSEAQQRNGRLQLMCYKYLWEKLLTQPFPTHHFLQLFSLNPDYILSQQIREFAIQAGAPVQTLNDVIRKYEYVCSMLPETEDQQLLLRYEYQKDQSLIGENAYSYDCDWVVNHIRSSLEFWRGEREATYAVESERWKCRQCKYAAKCPVNTVSSSTIQT